MTLSVEEDRAIQENVLRSIHCALPGKIESFDEERGTAVIRPMIRLIDGIEMPVLRDVPVFLPLPDLMTVNEGDVCLVIFADRALDRWMESGEEANGIPGRFHDLSDGFAFVGFPACQGGTI